MNSEILIGMALGLEDSDYKEKTGYETLEDLKFKKDRLEKIMKAKKP